MDTNTENKVENVELKETNSFNKSVLEETGNECDENCNHEHHQHKNKQNAQNLTKKEYNSLKEHKYEEAVKKYKTSYTILNKKSGLIVEMKASSPIHACTMIGWRPKNCKIIKETVNV